MNSPENFHRVCVLGIDGSGKSTAANEAALSLSEGYPYADIRVADSNGIFWYQGGELVGTRFSHLGEMSPTSESSKMGTILRLAAFTLARQKTEQLFSHAPNSLTISVRDPYRIDPSVHTSFFGPEWLRRLPLEQRLYYFDHLTSAPHPSIVAFLEAKTDKALANLGNRAVVYSTETPLRIAAAARALPKAIDAYGEEYGVPSTTIFALKPTTSSRLAETLEEFVPNRTYKVHSVAIAQDSYAKA